MTTPALNTLARRLAREIRIQDWSDAHSRADGARHNRVTDRTRSPQLPPDEAETVRMNVIWVVAQALADDDPTFNVREFAVAAGADRRYLYTSRGNANGTIEAGVRPTPVEFVYLSQSGELWIARGVDADPAGELREATGSTVADALSRLGL